MFRSTFPIAVGLHDPEDLELNSFAIKEKSNFVSPTKFLKIGVCSFFELFVQRSKQVHWFFE
jgi:hypothetical protein